MQALRSAHSGVLGRAMPALAAAARAGARPLASHSHLARTLVAHHRCLCSSQSSAAVAPPTVVVEAAEGTTPGAEAEKKEDKSSMKPREIVDELDRHIIGQADAKRAVAIAMRNRWRRQRVESPLKEDIMPKNILMIGPTGVGKTEIARKLAKMARAPFIKVRPCPPHSPLQSCRMPRAARLVSCGACSWPRCR